MNLEVFLSGGASPTKKLEQRGELSLAHMLSAIIKLLAARLDTYTDMNSGT